MEEGFVQVPGGRVYYRIAGEEAPGTPLLVVHGGPGAPHDYLEPLEGLAVDRPVVFYDQLGCGNSDRPEDLGLYTMPRFVEELAAVRRELGLEKVHILGQSFGCMLAADYLLDMRPAGVASLVMAGPCLAAKRFVADQRAHLEALPEDTRGVIATAEASGDFESTGYQEAMTAFYKQRLCRLEPWPECLDRTFGKMGLPVYHHMWGPSEFTMTGLLRDYDRTGELAKLDLPVLYVCGRFDEATPETTAFYRSLTPNAVMHVIEEASHMHHLEQTEAFLTIIGDFLRTNS